MHLRLLLNNLFFIYRRFIDILFEVQGNHEVSLILDLLINQLLKVTINYL